MSTRKLSVLQWVGVVVAPLAWTGQHVVGYGVGQARCGVGAAWNLGFDTWQIAIIVAAAGVASAIVLRATYDLDEQDDPPPGRIHFFAAAACAGNVVFLATREANYGDGPPEEGRWAGVVPFSRLHFFATAAMVANVLFLAVIFLDGLGSVFNSLCAQS